MSLRAGELGPVLVTGATGRVGRVLVEALLAHGQRVAVVSRAPAVVERLWPGRGVETRRADLARPETLAGVCAGVETLIHLASYAPAADEPDIYEAPGHWTVTAEGTRALMAEARDAGTLRRMLYLSTVKAMGDATGARGHPVGPDEVVPAPETGYGRAKLIAEGELLASAAALDIPGCVLRLPMVYGLAGEGNLARMIAAVAAHRFPPWPRIDNHRSAVHVEDAVAAVLLAVAHPASTGRTYCVTDGGAYSTRWIYERICRALGRPVPRWTVPLWVLRAAAGAGTLGERLFGRRMPLTLEGLDKLVGDAWFSSATLERELGFRARHRLDEEIEGLVRMVRGGDREGPRPPDSSVV
ncbi:NAD-dependent epimerase/dehydratase family protein [Marichromatium gracile]|uniref:Epimerase n=1 Tax=Marichromatium gracile TaxID=1048 RepID=A0ABR5VLM0_MARGR|nr:NAD-dependent epimerase/dehydratase family protein [Marichromatium gracile]KXX66042.1 epimerase [Marichromatium gracile]